MMAKNLVAMGEVNRFFPVVYSCFFPAWTVPDAEVPDVAAAAVVADPDAAVVVPGAKVLMMADFAQADLVPVDFVTAH